MSSRSKLYNVKRAKKYLHSRCFAERRGDAIVTIPTHFRPLVNFASRNMQSFVVGLIHDKSVVVTRSGRAQIVEFIDYIESVSVAVLWMRPVSGCTSVARRTPGALAAGFAALCSYVGQQTTAKPAESVTEARRQPITNTNCSCVGDRKRGFRRLVHHCNWTSTFRNVTVFPLRRKAGNMQQTLMLSLTRPLIFLTKSERTATENRKSKACKYEINRSWIL